ncbi:hypothetical protein [Streptomyces zagrosensis]|uniref:Uncharacterized protein n=1 Tax=Streptomyces zagrosensis TaxID=1042984 RepID=A0A7W9QGT7_9ACTN|nr:hypothetical protein [Streptomyces zagrosensis]MBB5939861.1 hypothetical protein [Streptomyces zagrosensis]
MRLVAYRSSDVSLLTGHRLPGELLGVRPVGLSTSAPPHRIAEPWTRRDERLYVVRDVAYVRYTEIDWASGQARLEIGPRELVEHGERELEECGGREHDGDVLTELVESAVEHGRRILKLRRFYGWVTPAARPPMEPLRKAGFGWEAIVPRSCWYEGVEVEREMWGMVGHA